MTVVDEMNGVINCDTQDHWDERGGHHVEWVAQPAHHSTYDNGGGYVGYHPYESHFPVSKNQNEDDADHQYRQHHRPHLSSLHILLHDGELRNIPHHRNVCIGKETACLCLKVVHFLFRFVGVVVFQFYL